MNTLLRLLGAIMAGAFVLNAAPAKTCGGGCCQGKGGCCAMSATAAEPGVTPLAGDAAKPDPKAARHPLRGVIVSVHPDTSELRVKHEAIPGVMRAMTMMFKVDPATVKTVKPGQSIRALMSREDGAWWLHDVKVVESAR